MKEGMKEPHATHEARRLHPRHINVVAIQVAMTTLSLVIGGGCECVFTPGTEIANI